MQQVIRFVGVLNGAVWFGALIFFTVAAGPAFFSAEMASFLPKPHASRAAEVIIGRLFQLQQWCAAIALLHLLVEYLYSGKRAPRFVLVLLVSALVLSALGGHWLLPKMHELLVVKYSATTTELEQAAAGSAFGMWHGISWIMNLLMIGMLTYYLWQLTHPTRGVRFTGLLNRTEKMQG